MTWGLLLVRQRRADRSVECGGIAVSTKNARENLEAEVARRSFEQIRTAAEERWEEDLRAEYRWRVARWHNAVLFTPHSTIYSYTPAFYQRCK